MKVLPQNGRLQVKPGSGIIMMVGDQTTFQHGVIVAVGEEPGRFKPGQHIAYNRMESVDLDGETLYFVPTESVIAVIDP